MDGSGLIFLPAAPSSDLETVRTVYRQMIFEPWHEISNNLTFLTNLDSDEPVQPPFKLRASKIFSVSSLKLIEYSSDEQRL